MGELIRFKGSAKEIAQKLLDKHYGNKAQAIKYLDVLSDFLLIPDKEIINDTRKELELYKKNVSERVDIRPTKDIFPNAVGIIEYAFTLKGVDYFEFSDYSNTPSDRAFNALSFFKELDMGCDRNYLKSHVQAAKDIFNNPKEIKLDQFIKLIHQMEERLDYLQPIDICYKLCSVVYFDATEQPNHFEYKHSLKKAEIFKTAPMDAFFLLPPIKKLLPYISSLSKDLPEFYQIAAQIEKKHIDNISMMLSEASKNKEFYKGLISQKQKDLLSTKPND